jgi:hypothetical protein
MKNCVVCATSMPPVTGDRLARGWKRLPTGLTCPTCVTAGWSLRAHSIPIAGPVEDTWETFRPALRQAFGDVTACANWMLMACYARDVRRELGATKLGKMPKLYLYPEARAQWPTLASQTVADLEQRVKRTYAAQRYELLWLQRRTLATLRYPQPIPLPAQMISVERTDGGAWHVSLRLADRRWTLRLRTGPEFARQIAALESVRAGVGVLGGAVLREISARQGDHRSESAPATRLLVTLVIRQPVSRQEAVEARVLRLRTTADRLWVGDLPRQPAAYVASGDALRAVVCGCDRRTDRIDEDLAVSRRWIPREREALREKRQAIASRAQQAVMTRCHTLSRQLVEWARAQRVTTIVYDDRVQSFLVRAPWHRLRGLVEEKAAAIGIAVTGASDDMIADQAAPLASKVSA